LERLRTGLFDTEKPWQSEHVISALGIITAVAFLALIPLAFLPVGDTLFGIVFVVAMAGFFLAALFRP
jgi:hypothetical protein